MIKEVPIGEDGRSSCRYAACSLSGVIVVTHGKGALVVTVASRALTTPFSQIDLGPCFPPQSIFSYLPNRLQVIRWMSIRYVGDDRLRSFGDIWGRLTRSVSCQSFVVVVSGRVIQSGAKFVEAVDLDS